MDRDIDFSFDRPVFGQELLGGAGQLDRASWLARRIRDDDIYFMQDGSLSQLLFKEVLSAFIAGLDIATVVLAFSLIERTIAGRLAFVGDKQASLAKSEVLLKNALARNWLSKEEHHLLDELRKLRNPIVHFRDHLSGSRPEVRADLSARTTGQVLENDAKGIVEAAIHILKKTAL